MRARRLCPRHRENTPSVIVYEDHGFCFGCHQRIPLDEIGVSAEEAVREAEYQEDIEATLRYVDSLPRKEIRGFSLPYSTRGYYLVWPDRSYYKLRIEGASDGQKYRGPTGHKKPWLKARVRNASEQLILVEGEFNALSLGAIEPFATVVSPGGAGDFYSKMAQAELREIATMFLRIDLVVDADAAGAQAAIEAKSRLVVLGCPNVRIHLVTKDFNDVLTQEGKDALREEAYRLGLL